MNARDFTPIRSSIPETRKPGPCCPPPILEFARAQPDHIGQDDMGEWAVKNQQVRFSPEVAPDPKPPIASFSTRSAVNDKDVSEALEWMFVHGELSEELSERIDEKALEFCQKRLEAAGRDA